MVDLSSSTVECQFIYFSFIVMNFSFPAEIPAFWPSGRLSASSPHSARLEMEKRSKHLNQAILSRVFCNVQIGQWPTEPPYMHTYVGGAYIYEQVLHSPGKLLSSSTCCPSILGAPTHAIEP